MSAPLMLGGDDTRSSAVQAAAAGKAEAERALRALERWRDDPVALALAAAPFDDEPETAQERAALSRLAMGFGAATS
jgi:hypothetical protein